MAKPLTCGAAAAVAAHVSFPGERKKFAPVVSWLSGDYDARLVAFAVGAASSIVAEGAHQLIDKETSRDVRLGKLERMLISPTVAGIAYAGIFNYLNPDSSTAVGGFGRMMMIGGLAEYGGEIAFQKLVGPLVLGKPTDEQQVSE